jgi:L-rhamnonate dehydratase
VLPGKRFRSAGKNARLGDHGDQVPLHLVKVTIGGQSGFGWSRVSKEKAMTFVGTPAQNLFTTQGMVLSEFRSIEFALLDWLGKVNGKPVYSLFSKKSIETGEPIYIDAYDTSLYLDDLHLSDDNAAVEFMQNEAQQGLDRGHKNFKIKVGRGGRHMSLDKGTERDIAVTKGIREIAGPEAKIMIDANNGYNLNITKHVLSALSEDNLYWIEEAFHEDHALYEDLKSWMDQQNMKVLIGDGEGLAAAPIVEWAKRGLIDVIQYDIRDYGFCNWIELGEILDKANVKSAPHNYGSSYGNYALGHLALAIDGFQFVEWDEIDVAGLDASQYAIIEGKAKVPSAPGFGLNLDNKYFEKIVKENGWAVK